MWTSVCTTLKSNIFNYYILKTALLTKSNSTDDFYLSAFTNPHWLRRFANKIPINANPLRTSRNTTLSFAEVGLVLL